MAEKFNISLKVLIKDIKYIFKRFGYKLIQKKLNQILKGYEKRKYKNVFIKTIYKFFGIKTNKQHKTRTENINIVNYLKKKK